MRLSRGARAALWALAAVVFLFVYVPLIVVAVNSFNSDRTFGWPPPGFTTDWWRMAAQAQGPRDALLTSVQAGLGATALALLLGSLLAFALTRFSFFGRSTISLLVILPVYAGLERLPDSHLQASADLGAGNWTTFRRVALPALLPSIAAGSIFTFSLSLGDYIAVQIVGGRLQVLGTVVLQNVTLDLPFAAALGTASVLIMVVYLLAVRRTGALDDL